MSHALCGTCLQRQADPQCAGKCRECYSVRAVGGAIEVPEKVPEFAPPHRETSVGPPPPPAAEDEDRAMTTEDVRRVSPQKGGRR